MMEEKGTHNTMYVHTIVKQPRSYCIQSVSGTRTELKIQAERLDIALSVHGHSSRIQVATVRSGHLTRCPRTN
jgi:hypothetical protein